MGLRESARVVASRYSAEVLCGRYHLDDLIGSGGAADVHRGFDLRLKRPVAVKVFRPDTGFDQDRSASDDTLARDDSEGRAPPHPPARTVDPASAQLHNAPCRRAHQATRARRVRHRGAARRTTPRTPAHRAKSRRAKRPVTRDRTRGPSRRKRNADGPSAASRSRIRGLGPGAGWPRARSPQPGTGRSRRRPRTSAALHDEGGIRIGNGVMIAPKVSLITGGHPLPLAERREYLSFAPTVVEDDVWFRDGCRGHAGRHHRCRCGGRRRCGGHS